MYKAVIFDLDGTLVYSPPELRYWLVGQTLKHLGVESFDNRHIDSFWFETDRDKIISEHFGLEPDAFWKQYLHFDSVELTRQYARPYSDIGFIEELRKRNYKIGIVTGAPFHIMHFEVSLLGKSNFDAVVRAQESSGIKPKPSPQGLYKCLGIINVDRSEAVYVGNAPEDVLAAQNAKVFDVFLDRKEYAFGAINPSLTVNSLYELRKLLY